jgi:hypothetical protein
MIALTFALAEKYKRWRLALPEIAQELGMAEQTLRNRMSKGQLQWIKKDGGMLFADVRDLAQYLDEQRTPPAPQKRRGRRRAK